MKPWDQYVEYEPQFRKWTKNFLKKLTACGARER